MNDTLRYEVGGASIYLHDNADGNNWCRICRARDPELWCVSSAHGGWTMYCRDCIAELTPLFVWTVGRGRAKGAK